MTSSLNSISKVNSDEPSWVAGAETVTLTVRGTGAAVTSAVASLVRVSSLLASSVKVTRTWMVCPCSLAVRVWVEPVAPEISDPPAIHW